MNEQAIRKAVHYAKRGIGAGMGHHEMDVEQIVDQITAEFAPSVDGTTMDHFVKLVSSNVDYAELSDYDFRTFVRAALSIVEKP
jgi:hypothetical protein